MEILETERLVLRRPRAGDAEAVFTRYASDPEATRYMAWPTSRSLDETVAFIRLCDALWTRWPNAGPLLVLARDGVTLLGGAGIVNDDDQKAQAGYILARDAWGRGYATEALLASVYVDHAASCHVLEKAGFVREGIRAGRPNDFPNLPPAANRDAALYALAL